MKILFLTSSYPSPSDVANRNFLTDLADSLTDRNVHVFVICPHQPGLLFSEMINNVAVIRFAYWFPLSKEQLGGKGGIIATLKKEPIVAIQIIPFCICQLFTALKTIKLEKIDLIHSHWIIPQGIIGGLIKSMTNVPHVSSIHGTDIHLGYSSRLAHPILNFTSKFTDYITTNSTYTKELFRQIIPSRKMNINTIPMGIFPDEFSKLKSTSSASHHLKFKSTLLEDLFENKVVSDTRNKCVNILFVGRLIPLKGVQYLIKAVKIIKNNNYNIQLVIIGNGPTQNELKKLTTQLELSSITLFLDQQNRQTLSLYYQNADIFVLPSITHENQSEGLGVVLLEAMASEVPVIGSDTGGIPDIIEDGINGLLVPPGDSEALAEAIIQIIHNPDMAERFKKAGIETVEKRFTWDRIADQFIEIYQQVLEK